MHSHTKFWLLVALVVVASWAPSSARAVAVAGQGPTMASIGPLAFGPDGTLFAADNQGAKFVALDLGAQASGGAAGAKGLDAINEKLAALLGTGAHEITITDLAVHPRTRNAYVSAMRGQGAGAAPTLFRIDGTGKIDLVALRIAEVSERRAAERARRQCDRPPEPALECRSPTWRLPTAVSGWPGCRTRSSPRSCARSRIRSPMWITGTSVEIYHGNHRQLETRSPVNAFVPYMIDNKPHLLAGYTCTPLVKFPIADLKPGDKVRGTTIAEFGAGNRRARHDRVPQGRSGIPVDDQQQPRRDEDSDQHVRECHSDHDAGETARRAVCRSRRSRA